MKNIHGNKKTQTHKTTNKMNWQVKAIILISILLFVLIVFFAVKTYAHYKELENHRRYFMQPNAPIQDWMTIHSIIKEYNLTESEIYEELNVTPGTFVEELGVDDSIVVDSMTIRSICEKKHLDCNGVVKRLNNIRT